jgi:hypothetical protein
MDHQVLQISENLVGVVVQDGLSASLGTKNTNKNCRVKWQEKSSSFLFLVTLFRVRT